MNWYIEVLKKYATFSGRARRKEYWMFFLFNFLISMVLSIITVVAVDPTGQNNIIGNIYSLAVLLPSLAVAVRRVHDTGKSGWFILIPIYNLVLMCTEGDVGDNEYGPDPKAEANDSSVDVLDSGL